MKEQLNLKNMLIYLNLMKLKINTYLNILIKTIIKYSRKKMISSKTLYKCYNTIQGIFISF